MQSISSGSRKKKINKKESSTIRCLRQKYQYMLHWTKGCEKSNDQNTSTLCEKAFVKKSISIQQILNFEVTRSTHFNFDSWVRTVSKVFILK